MNLVIRLIRAVAHIYVELKKTAKSHEYLKKAIRIDPRDAQAFLDLGDLLISTDIGGAFDAFKTFPEYVDAYLRLAAIAKARNNISLSMIRDALKVDDKCPNALLMLGDLELKNDDWVKAKDTFPAAKDANDGKDSYATLCLGKWNYFAAVRSEKRAPKLEATHLEKAKELYTKQHWKSSSASKRKDRNPNEDEEGTPGEKRRRKPSKRRKRDKRSRYEMEEVEAQIDNQEEMEDENIDNREPYDQMNDQVDDDAQDLLAAAGLEDSDADDDTAAPSSNASRRRQAWLESDEDEAELKQPESSLAKKNSVEMQESDLD